MSNLSNCNLLLLLIGIDSTGKSNEDGLGGITRVQKYVFLLEREFGIISEEGFDFEAYKAGPYSAKIYDDLELLENLGLIMSEPVADAMIEEEAEDIEEICFEDLMGDGGEDDDGQVFDGFGASDVCQERRYYLTAKGKEKIKELTKTKLFIPTVDSIQQLKKQFGKHTLPDLLYYVYTKYPETTTESKIKERVLGRRRG